MDVMRPDLLWLGGRCYRLPVLDSSYENYQECERSERTEFNVIEVDNIGHTKNVFKMRTAEKLNACVLQKPLILIPRELSQTFLLLQLIAYKKNVTYNVPYDSDIRNYDCEEETCDIEELIETLPNNRFKLSLVIPQIFCSKIIGAKGVTKRRIETDTNTTLIIPRPMENNDVVIKGSSKRSIIMAKKNIDIIIASARQKLISTHFISVPMNCEEIKQNFILFKEQVLKTFYSDRGVDESIFQNPDKLHLTIGMLVLIDQKERTLAVELLKNVYENSLKFLIGDKNNFIEMRGIEYMNDDPAEVDVLYGKINTNANGGIIQKIADAIAQYFIQHKLLKSEDEEQVKLHVTLMNTLFREEEFDELNLEVDNFNKMKPNKKIRRTFNATNILKNFHDFYFGQQELKSIHLSLRFSTAKDGYYKSSYVINI